MKIHEDRERPHELRLDLPAAHSAERLARAVMRQFVQREGSPSSELDPIEFVASELLSTAVDHGGGHSAMEEDDAPPNVRVQFHLRLEPRDAFLAGEFELRLLQVRVGLDLVGLDHQRLGLQLLAQEFDELLRLRLVFYFSLNIP